jgi:hypothetical protein
MKKSDILPKLRYRLRSIVEKPDLFRSAEEKEFATISVKINIHKEKERVGNDSGVTPLYYRRH